MAHPKTAPKTEPAASRPGPALAFRRILVPIDFSAESTRALKIAANFGPGDGGNLLLVHVVGPVYDIRDYGYGVVRTRA